MTRQQIVPWVIVACVAVGCLAFIVNPLTARGFASLFSTHPPLEDRIARLMSQNR